jgi:hypothetical protein
MHDDHTQSTACCVARLVGLPHCIDNRYIYQCGGTTWGLKTSLNIDLLLQTGSHVGNDLQMSCSSFCDQHLDDFAHDPRCASASWIEGYRVGFPQQIRDKLDICGGDKGCTPHSRQY